MRNKLMHTVAHRCLEPLSIRLGLGLGPGLGAAGGGSTPYVPSLRFNDARNSQYFGVNFIGF